ncbi:hypothetical protein BC829DRAFT_415460 [Chytridium lagenaria]|nr:hypothetical protein BC829DRAFT_415460 [Chytridium lagenaria]
MGAKSSKLSSCNGTPVASRSLFGEKSIFGCSRKSLKKPGTGTIKQSGRVNPTMMTTDSATDVNTTAEPSRSHLSGSQTTGIGSEKIPLEEDTAESKGTGSSLIFQGSSVSDRSAHQPSRHDPASSASKTTHIQSEAAGVKRSSSLRRSSLAGSASPRASNTTRSSGEGDIAADSDEVVTLAAFGIAPTHGSSEAPLEAMNMTGVEQLGPRTQQEEITSMLGAGNPEQWGRRRMSLPTEAALMPFPPSFSRRGSAAETDQNRTMDFETLPARSKDLPKSQPRRRLSIDSIKSNYSTSNPPKGILKNIRRSSVSSNTQIPTISRYPKPPVSSADQISTSHFSSSGYPIDSLNPADSNAPTANSASSIGNRISSGTSLGHVTSRSYSSNATTSNEPLLTSANALKEEHENDFDVLGKFEAWLLRRCPQLHARAGEDLESLNEPGWIYYLSTGVIDLIAEDSGYLMSRVYGPALLASPIDALADHSD